VNIAIFLRSFFSKWPKHAKKLVPVARRAAFCCPELAWQKTNFAVFWGMRNKSETPFDTLEGAHEYVALMAEIAEDVRRDVEGEIASTSAESEQRRKEALQLISYNLTKLSTHLTSSRRILNDLRSLRRLLFSERNRLARKASASSR
jgi:hypothetical protein